MLYINSDDSEKEGYVTDYIGLVDDLIPKEGNNLFIKYGQSFHQHKNHLEAIRLVDIDKYDLFLKIDDDDIYRTCYVEDVVRDFEKNRWDFSGSHCYGVVNGHRWRPNLVYKNFTGLSDEDCIGMSGTWAFSKVAIKEILNIDDNGTDFADNIWRRNLRSNSEIKICRRENSSKNYIYNIHGKNISTSDWLETNKKNTPTEKNTTTVNRNMSMNGITSMRLALHFTKKALRLLPKDIARSIKNRLKI